VCSVPFLPWTELARRTWRDALEDDVLGLTAQLSYYFFLALFPAILFLLALASFSLSNLTDLGRTLGPFVSPQVLELIQDQMRRLANNESGGLLTFGVAGARWSSSAALVSTVSALNRAYDIEDGRGGRSGSWPGASRSASPGPCSWRWRSCWSDRRWRGRWATRPAWAGRSSGHGSSCNGRSSSYS
jgi:hypothetical protein